MDLQGSLFGDEIHEYRVVILPGDSMKQEVQTWRTQFCEEWSLNKQQNFDLEKTSAAKEPGILLAQIQRPYDSDEFLIGTLSRTVEKVRSFRLAFGGFFFQRQGELSSLYLKLKDPGPLKLLAKQMAKSVKQPAVSGPWGLILLGGLSEEEIKRFHFLVKDKTGLQTECWCDKLSVWKRKPASADDSFELLTELRLN